MGDLNCCYCTRLIVNVPHGRYSCSKCENKSTKCERRLPCSIYFWRYWRSFKRFVKVLTGRINSKKEVISRTTNIVRAPNAH